MAVRKVRDISQPLILIIGLLIVLGAIVTYFYILNGVYGRFDRSQLIPDDDAVNDYLFGRKPRIAVLYSEYTENLLPERSTWLRENISTWKKFLNLMNINYDVIRDKDIEKGDVFEYDIIVLPGSKSLSDIEIVTIKKFLDGGGSIFATNGTASYSDNGKWRGWDFLSEVFGIKFTKDIIDSSGTKVHTLRGGLPITANIPTGFPMRVATWDVPMAVEVLDPRTEQISFWYNYRLEDGLVREEIHKSAGMVYGTYGKGRFIWMGFEMSSVIGIQDDYVFFERLLSNSIKWLDRNPVAYLKEWPGKYNAAAVILPVISGSPRNVENIFPILESEKVEVTFLTDRQTAQANKSLIDRLTRYGEIAAIADIGYLTSMHDSINTLNDYEVQLKELDKTKKAIESITGHKVQGAKPYYGLYDHNTLKALIESGYTYIITDSMTDRSVPKNIVLESGKIVVITKAARDDYEVIRDFSLTQPEYQFYTYQEDIDRVLFESSLYLYKPHTDYQLKSEYAGVVKQVIDDLQQKNFWITTPEEIAAWYSKKNYVELRAEQRSSGRIALRVTNPGDEDIAQVVINIEMSAPAEDLSLSTEIIGVKPAAFIYNKEKNIVYLYVNDLKKHESRTYYLDYSRPNT